MIGFLAILERGLSAIVKIKKQQRWSDVLSRCVAGWVKDRRKSSEVKDQRVGLLVVSCLLELSQGSPDRSRGLLEFGVEGGYRLQVPIIRLRVHAGGQVRHVVEGADGKDVGVTASSDRDGVWPSLRVLEQVPYVAGPVVLSHHRLWNTVMQDGIFLAGDGAGQVLAAGLLWRDLDPENRRVFQDLAGEQTQRVLVSVRGRQGQVGILRAAASELDDDGCFVEVHVEESLLPT